MKFSGPDGHYYERTQQELSCTTHCWNGVTQNKLCMLAMQGSKKLNASKATRLLEADWLHASFFAACDHAHHVWNI